MRLLLVFLLNLIVQPALAQTGAIPSNRITLNGMVTIQIQNDSLPSNVPVLAQVYHVFPASDYSEVSDTLFRQKGQTQLLCPVRTIQDGYLWIGPTKLKLLLIPGDTVRIHVAAAADSSANLVYSFRGFTEVVQRYNYEKVKQFPIEPGQLAMNAGAAAPNLAIFKRQLDSLTLQQTRFWQLYQQTHELPAWFVRHESDALRYDDAMLRLYMVWYQIDFQHKTQKLPAGYFDFLKRIPVRNDAARYDYAYLNFTREYTQWKFKSLGPTGEDGATNRSWQQMLRNELGEQTGIFYEIWQHSAGAKDNPEVAHQYFTKQKFPASHQYLVTYLLNRSAGWLKHLKPGDQAPNFFLTDTLDSLVSLREFKGQVVYLCFWFATCGGCIHEFPYENKLVDEFSGKPVRIVSICTSTKPDKWRETIKKVGLKTINLYANSAWQKTLEQKYAVNVYPHYVLIGADGKILENFATRPSNGAAMKIQTVLAGMKN